MTRSHKIGWLVLAAALLFALWRLPRLHGQGFGSFSHDQPYLAAGKAAALTPPLTNLQAWWHWEDVGSLATNWIDRISGFSITNDSSLAPTNDGTGVWFSGNKYATNDNVEIFNKGVATVIIAKTVGAPVNGRFLVGLPADGGFGAWAGIETYADNLIYNQSTIEPGSSTDKDNLIASFLYNREQMIGWSLVANYGAWEGWSNFTMVASSPNAYIDAHDNNYFGNGRYGTNSWNGYIYDILVYTNIYKWSTSSVPAMSNIWAWYSNVYEAPVAITSPTNISGYPVFAWYVADNAYTNGSTYVLPDLYTNAWHLTNSDAASKWPISSNAINSHAYLRFDGVDDYLKSVNASNSQPTEFFIVSRFTTNQVASAYETFFDSLYVPPRNIWWYEYDGAKMGLAAGNYLSLPYSVYPNYTNGWLISNGKLNGSESLITLNGLSYPLFFGANLKSDIGSQALSGLIVGSAFDLTSFGHLQIAEIVFFKTNLPLRLKNGVNAYLKTKYGL